VDSTIPADAVATQDTVTQLVSAIRRVGREEPGASAVALLALAAGQDVEPAGGSDGIGGRWRIARKGGRRPGSSLMRS
jgi:hypothetical protein